MKRCLCVSFTLCIKQFALYSQRTCKCKGNGNVLRSGKVGRCVAFRVYEPLVWKVQPTEEPQLPMEGTTSHSLGMMRNIFKFNMIVFDSLWMMYSRQNLWDSSSNVSQEGFWAMYTDPGGPVSGTTKYSIPGRPNTATPASHIHAQTRSACLRYKHSGSGTNGDYSVTYAFLGILVDVFPVLRAI